MADYLTKHEPVDDYPYICYAPDADMNTDDVSSGGGGGGGGGAPIITVITENETTSSDKTFLEIASMIGNGQFPIVKDSTEEDFDTYAYLQFFMPDTVIVFATPGGITEGNVAIINYAFLPDDSVQMSEYTSNH